MFKIKKVKDWEKYSLTLEYFDGTKRTLEFDTELKLKVGIKLCNWVLKMLKVSQGVTSAITNIPYTFKPALSGNMNADIIVYVGLPRSCLVSYKAHH